LKFSERDFSKKDKENGTMEMETQQVSGSLAEGIALLAAVAAQLERTASGLEARFAPLAGEGSRDASGELPRLVAAVEGEPAGRWNELDARLKAVEEQLAELRAKAGGNVAVAASGRKTLSVAAAHLLAKHGIDTLEQVNGGALDAALSGLSLEQRIAVKSQLLRAGVLG
jgi:hypothetical protein